MPDGSEIGEIRIEFIASETAISASTGEIPHQTEGVRSRTGSAWERWRRSSNFYDLALRRTACKVFLNGHVFHRVCHPPRAAPERYRRPNRVVGGRSPAYKGAIIPQVRLRAAVGARRAPRCFGAAGVGVLRRGIRTSARPWRTSTCRGHIGQSFGTQGRPNVFFRGRRTPARVRSPCKPGFGSNCAGHEDIPREVKPGITHRSNCTFPTLTLPRETSPEASKHLRRRILGTR